MSRKITTMRRHPKKKFGYPIRTQVEEKSFQLSDDLTILLAKINCLLSIKFCLEYLNIMQSEGSLNIIKTLDSKFYSDVTLSPSDRCVCQLMPDR